MSLLFLPYLLLRSETFLSEMDNDKDIVLYYARELRTFITHILKTFWELNQE